MNNQLLIYKKTYFFPVLILSLKILLSPSECNAQTQYSEAGIVTCKIKVNTKEYQLRSNAEGYFDQISGVQPLELVPITVIFSNSQPNEKVILTAQHGGNFDNQKQVKVVQLDQQKKCSFTFKTTRNPGLFEITLRKGSDTNVVQLWVSDK